MRFPGGGGSGDRGGGVRRGGLEPGYKVRKSRPSLSTLARGDQGAEAQGPFSNLTRRDPLRKLRGRRITVERLWNGEHHNEHRLDKLIVR